MTGYLEHANVTVRSLDEAVAFIRAALPDFQVRGRGEEPRRWVHVGTAETYIALEEAQRDDESGQETYAHPGINHLGIVVDDAEAVRARLKAAGYEEGYRPPPHPHRKRIYFFDRDRIEYEFVEYLSPAPAERNDYDLG